MTFVVQIKVEIVNRETGELIFQSGAPYQGDPSINGGPMHACELAGMYEDRGQAIFRFHQLVNVVRPLGRLK